MNPEFIAQNEPETTGRYIVTFREDASTEAVAALENFTGVKDSNLVRSADFQDSGIDMDQVPSEGGAILGNLGMAVVNAAPDAAGALSMEAGEDSAILAVEPEGIMYALSDLKGVSIDYLRGFRDCAQSLYTSVSSASPGDEGETDLIEASAFLDSPTHTWGLIATKAATSRLSLIHI